MNSADVKEIAGNAKRIISTLAGGFPSRSGLNPSVLEGAARFIEQEFEKLGYPVTKQEYTADGVPVRNLIAQTKGSGPRRIVLGAHYDTVLGTPGADDNASGVAGLLELARLLRDWNGNLTIDFVAFAHEEPPYFYTRLMGSRQYARKLRTEAVNVVGMLSLEMIGYAGQQMSQVYPFPLLRQLGRYPRFGDYIALVGNLRSLGLLRLAKRAMKESCKIGVETLSAPGFIPPLFLSDHSSFWKYRYPALMVTDTAFLRNPHYHAHTDTEETINYDFLAEVVIGILGVVMALELQAR
ncbi:MAG TPA: M28 family peptidase [Bacteroidota bacterium]|nr:M28 family peptidase [Bacteroidota bacterium]